MEAKSFAGVLAVAGAAAMLASPTAPARAQAMENPPVPSVCDLGAGENASTCMFMANAMGLPVSARTDFPDDFDLAANNPDPLRTAEHELFHGIGFTTAYQRFRQRLIPTPGAGMNGIPAGSRSYSTNGMANGIIFVLTPAAMGTHADPAATGAAPWPATGYNENRDVMSPNQIVGTRLNANDAAVLNNAFGWGAAGIRINIVNVGGTLDATDLAILNNAVAAVNAFWPAQAGSPVFTWSVAEVTLVPEPATWATMLLGMGVVGAVVRRRARIAGAA
jgi:hypothetical protein